MSKKTLIYVLIIWCVFKVIEYYFIPYFILPLSWIGLSFALLTITIVQVIKVVRERKSLTKFRIAKAFMFLTLFYFTYNNWLVSRVIEKADWKIFYNRRMDIVQQVNAGELYPNVSWSNWVCELPFEFPVVSHGGNDIGIYQNKVDNSLTVIFWVFRNFFEAPSIRLVYSNDIQEIKKMEALIAHDPKNNWRIDNNWYRIRE